jgi:hypothetical protein
VKIESPVKALLSIGWKQIQGLWMVKRALKDGVVQGPVPVPEEYGGGMSEGTDDQFHFQPKYFPWDNYTDRHSHGIDGRDIERMKYKNDDKRRYYWAAKRNRAANWGKMQHGVRDDQVALAEAEWDLVDLDGNRVRGTEVAKDGTAQWPSDWNGVRGTTRAIGVTKDGRSLPMTYRIWKWPFLKRCVRMTYGWALWEDDSGTGDKDVDWCGVQINFHPWRKFGEGRS